MSAVRPFSARIVRAERAEQTVTALSELDEADLQHHRAVIDPSAYQEAADALYVYRQHPGDTSHTGLVCEIALRALDGGHVHGHEAIQPHRVETLVRHRSATWTQPALVSLLHCAGPAFARTVAAAQDTPPVLDFAGPGGVPQTVWRVPDAATQPVTDELAEADLYLADGHHRVAAALEEWRAGIALPDAGLLCVVHPMDGLRLSAFHRRIVGPVDADELLGLLTPTFRVRPHAGPPPSSTGGFGMYVDHTWYDVRYDEPGDRADAELDVTLLHDRVLDRPATPGRPEPFEVESGTSIPDLAQRCDADGGALFTLAPPPLEVLTNRADAGHVMPPKTTYFEPKPCAGIFVRRP